MSATAAEVYNKNRYSVAVTRVMMMMMMMMVMMAGTPATWCVPGPAPR